MRPSSYPEHEVTSINWQAFKLILPYLFEFKKRIALRYQRTYRCVLSCTKEKINELK